MSDRASQRKQCRAARAKLSPGERKVASLAICRRLRSSSHYWSANRIAFFWPVGAEVDLSELLGSALAHGKRCYLPVMRQGGWLRFVRFRAGDPLVANGYGIPEPRYSARHVLAPGFLDMVCMPLAGFDRSGTRLGLGGGYYDRSFGFTLRGHGRRPRLVGTAFACQELASIPRQPWDVPLDAVVTERELIRCAGGP